MNIKMEQLEAENEHLKKRNSELHRRLQQKESPWQAEVNGLRLKSEWNEKNMWFAFKRMCNAHDEMKQVFKLIAPRYDLPCEKFNSVMDNKFCDSEAEGIWANVYLSKMGGIESYNVLDLVKRFVNDHKGD